MLENIKVEVDDKRAENGCKAEKAGNAHVKDRVDTWPCEDLYEERGVC